MKFNSILHTVLFLISFLSPLFLQAQQTQELITFNLEDQYETSYNQNSWSDSVLVVFGSDKNGAEFNPVWAKALYESFQKENITLPLAYTGIADLSAVPFFMKGVVKKFFQKEGDNGIIMDWEGKFAEAYTFKEDHCNILIFDSNKQLIYQTAVTELEEKKIEQIIENVKNTKS